MKPLSTQHIRFKHFCVKNPKGLAGWEGRAQDDVKFLVNRVREYLNLVY